MHCPKTNQHLVLCTCIAVLAFLHKLWLNYSSSTQLILFSRARTGTEVSGLKPSFSSLPSFAPLPLDPFRILFIWTASDINVSGWVARVGLFPKLGWQAVSVDMAAWSILLRCLVNRPETRHLHHFDHGGFTPVGTVTVVLGCEYTTVFCLWYIGVVQFSSG